MSLFAIRFFGKAKIFWRACRPAAGETMLLYSDGIIECVNSNRELLGMDGFRSAAMKAWNESPEVFLENLFRIFDAWAVSQQDDISFVLIRYGKSQ